MPICFRTILFRLCPGILLNAALLLPVSAPAQTLARPGWAGSGVTVEPWWRHAVFYRIDPERFQDSTDDGHGDLAGVAKRLDYLQSLGVDALILQAAPGAQLSPDGFDDLARGAVGSHLRVLVELDVPASQAAAADAAYLALARSWLNQGAAGLYVPTQRLAKVDGANHIAVLMHQLRLLTNSFPGERILLADGSADADVAASLARETQLTASAPLSTDKPDAASLREQLQKALGQASSAASTGSRHSRTPTASANTLLLATRITAQSTPGQQTTLQYSLAAVLLASRGAVLLEFGQELGLIPPVKDAAPLMQWTPSNVSPKPPPPPPPLPATTAPVKNAESSYNSYQAYIPPPPRDLFKPPRMPEIVESDNPQPVNVDPDSLPGFTAGAIDPSLSATNAATANVAVETLNPASLLNFYRKLIRLRHDGALHNGMQSFADRDADDVLLFTRHSGGTIVVVCNLADKPLPLDLNTLHLKLLLRVLAGSLKDGAVPAGAVVIAEAR